MTVSQCPRSVMKPNPIIVRLSFETSGFLICVSVFHGWPRGKSRPQKPASASGFPPLGPARARPPPSGSPELWPDLRSGAPSSSTCVHPAAWPAAATARGASDVVWTQHFLLQAGDASSSFLGRLRAWPLCPGPIPAHPQITEPELGNPLFPRI